MHGDKFIYDFKITGSKHIGSFPFLFLQIRASLWILQSVLNPILQLVGINLKDVVHLANTTGSECLLVDVDVAIIGASIGSVHIEVH